MDKVGEYYEKFKRYQIYYLKKQNNIK